MVLAEAFMKRNDLKKRIAELSQVARQNLWQDKDVPINFDNGTRQRPEEALAVADALMAELQALNVAINVANLRNNALLRELETTTARIALLEGVVQSAKSYPGDKVRRPSMGYGSSLEGQDQFVNNELLVDVVGITSKLASLSNRKREIEKELAHNNFVTEVVI